MRWFHQILFQVVEQPGDALVHGRIEIALRTLELRSQSAIPIELYPVVTLRIDLRAGPM